MFSLRMKFSNGHLLVSYPKTSTVEPSLRIHRVVKIAGEMALPVLGAIPAGRKFEVAERACGAVDLATPDKSKRTNECGVRMGHVAFPRTAGAAAPSVTVICRRPGGERINPVAFRLILLFNTDQ